MQITTEMISVVVVSIGAAFSVVKLMVKPVQVRVNDLDKDLAAFKESQAIGWRKLESDLTTDLEKIEKKFAETAEKLFTKLDDLKESLLREFATKDDLKEAKNSRGRKDSS